MFENLVNVCRFNIDFALYLLLYAVCCYFPSKASRITKTSRKTAPTSLKRKIRLESLKISS